jgi:hypothetical protein
MGKTLGKDYESRKLSQEVRDLALVQARDILKGKKKVSTEFYNALLLKLAGAALPRLNEISGEGGDPLEIIVKQYEAKDDKSA